MNEWSKSGRRWLALAGLGVLAGVALGLAAHYAHPVSGGDIYAALNPAYAGFGAEAQQALRADSAAQAGAVDGYFRQRANPLPVKVLTALPAWNAETRRIADEALRDIFTCQGVTAQVPRLANGGLDWNWRGPKDDPEYMWFLNRLTELPALYVAWRETGEEKYRTTLQAQWLDWIEHNPRPAHYSLSGPWRALEAARRLQDSWLPILFDKDGWKAVGEALPPALLLASIKEHAECLRDTHALYGNHVISEMAGLTMVALAFPEFRDAPQWLDYALATTRREVARQFYPDGAQTELTNTYQLVTLQSLQQLADMLTAAGREKDWADGRPALENAWNYFVYVMTPMGGGPMDNDSDFVFNAAWVRSLAGGYARADWLYVTSGGKEGNEPAEPPSRFFPWAGQAVMRGGWQSHDQWAFFEAGPYGSDHQHDDGLQLDMCAEGRELLVDNGRYTYQPGAWRDYFAGPSGHNVVLLDGQGTMRPPDVAAGVANIRAEMGPGMDFFSATAPYAGDGVAGQGPGYHTRAVLYVRQRYWIVVDRVLAASGARRLEALWHFHPDCTVRTADGLVYTEDKEKGNLGLLAVNAPKGGWGVELIRGRETPTPQGWYSAVFNQKAAATCADFSAVVDGPVTCAWVIWTEPAGHEVKAGRPQVTVREDSAARLRLELQWPDGRVDEATVPFVKEEAVAWTRTAGAKL
jgi:hypothetical protein